MTMENEKTSWWQRLKSGLAKSTSQMTENLFCEAVIRPHLVKKWMPENTVLPVIIVEV